MARLYLFAEGQTEETFADTVLKPHLANHGVYLNALMIRHARRRGRAYRGGGRNYESMRNDIRNLLAQEKAGDVFFTTMIDLYAIPAKFPRLGEAEVLRYDPFRRVEFLERAFADDIRDPRFIPYLQLHEFEAILFSDPLGFACFYAGCDKQAAALQAIADQYTSPELIDDEQSTSPSHRILAQFPAYSKRAAGPVIADLIGLEKIRSRCPHFHAWLSRLESPASTPSRGLSPP